MTTNNNIHPDTPSSTLPMTDRDRDLEALRQAAEVISGDAVAVGEGGQYAAADPQSGKIVRVSVQSGLPGEANPHELLHILHSKFKVPKALERGLPHYVWNALEDGRINRLGNKRFGRKFKEVHEEHFRRSGTVTPQELRNLSEAQKADALAVARVAMGSDPESGSLKTDALLIKMRPFLEETMDKGDATDVARAAVRMVALLDLLERKREEEREEERERDRYEDYRRREDSDRGGDATGGDEDSTSDEGGERGCNPTDESTEGESTEGESGEGAGDEGSEGESGNGDGDEGESTAGGNTGEDATEGESGEGDATGGDDSDSDGGTDSGEEWGASRKDDAGEGSPRTENSAIGETIVDGEAVVQDSAANAADEAETEDDTTYGERGETDEEAIERLIAEAEEEAAKAERRIRDAMRRAERAAEQRKGKEGATSISTSIGASSGYFYPEGKQDHAVVFESDNLPLVPLAPGKAIMELMASIPDSKHQVVGRRTGALDIYDAYKMGIEDYKVFSEDAPSEKKLIIMLDTSGSMRSYVEPENRLKGITLSNACYAWDIVSALTGRYPDAEVYTFRSWQKNHESIYTSDGAREGTIIQPIPYGYRLSHQNGENADCAMLLWLEQYVGSSVGETTVVIISDGTPSAGVVKCDTVKHTQEIAERLHNSGMNYLSVLIRCRIEGIYPSDVTVHINDEDDYDALADAFTHLDSLGF